MRNAHKTILAATAASLATLLFASAAAEAQPRRAPAGRELTVKRRPFTDSGNVVPVGSESRYVYDSQFRRPDTFSFDRSGYGRETLPGRFDLPGGRY
jgi:hypothetical protein